MIKCEDKYNSGLQINLDLMRKLFYIKNNALHWNHRDPCDFKTLSACKTWNKRFAGKPSGSESQGYLKTGIGGRRYLNHRIIYFMHTGVFPHIVDHIDGNTLNNSINNLRDVDKVKNGVNCNISKSNTTGRKGVYFHKTLEKWTASIVVGGKLRHLGVFNDFYSASLARSNAEAVYYKNYSREQAIKYCMEN